MKNISTASFVCKIYLETQHRYQTEVCFIVSLMCGEVNQIDIQSGLYHNITLKMHVLCRFPSLVELLINFCDLFARNS